MNDADEDVLQKRDLIENVMEVIDYLMMMLFAAHLALIKHYHWLTFQLTNELNCYHRMGLKDNHLVLKKMRQY